VALCWALERYINIYRNENYHLKRILILNNKEVNANILDFFQEQLEIKGLKVVFFTIWMTKFTLF
jgi:hypothetical protein